MRTGTVRAGPPTASDLAAALYNMLRAVELLEQTLNELMEFPGEPGPRCFDQMRQVRSQLQAARSHIQSEVLL